MSNDTGVGHGGRAPPWLPTDVEVQTPRSDNSEGTGRPLADSEAGEINEQGVSELWQTFTPPPGGGGIEEKYFQPIGSSIKEDPSPFF